MSQPTATSKGGQTLTRLKVALPSVLTYAAMLIYGLVTLTVSIHRTEGIEPDDMDKLLIIYGSTLVGTTLGGVVAVFKPRAWLALVAVGLWIGVIYAFGESDVDEDVLAAMIITLVIFIPTSLVLRPNGELFAALGPALFAVGAMLVWMDHQNLDHYWFQGQKWAVWDGYALGLLAGTVFLLLIYLIARQIMARTMWQLPVAGDSEVRAPTSGLRWTTIFVLLGLLAVLTASTAFAAPYLFRSVVADEPGDDDDPVGQEMPPPEPEPVEGEGSGELKEMVQQVVEQGVDWVILLVMTLLAMLGLRFVLYPPTRRVALLRHLERPAWPVPATTRIANQWTRALIALRDVGVRPGRSESVPELVDRATSELTRRYGASPTGLAEAARIYSQVHFSLGVGSRDAVEMAAATELLCEYVEEHLNWKEQVRNLYLPIDPYDGPVWSGLIKETPKQEG